MVKRIRILFFIFSLGIFLFPNPTLFAQESDSHQSCCCIYNEEHQPFESSMECCGTSCHDCTISHSSSISILYFNQENFEIKKIILECQKPFFISKFHLPKEWGKIWQPPEMG